MRSSAILLCLPLLCLVGCRDGGDSKTPLSAVVPSDSATTPAFARTAPAAPAPDAPVAAAEPEESDGENVAATDGDGEAGEEAGEERDAGEAADSGEPDKDTPIPDVVVKNVGMHIGGEANTAEQKRPIRAAVALHYDAMKRCYAKADTPPTKAVTFGVDMRIKGEGGTPKITNPRSGLKGGGAKECLVSVFEAIEFPKQPKGQARMVSFSIEFRKN